MSVGRSAILGASLGLLVLAPASGQELEWKLELNRQVRPRAILATAPAPREVSDEERLRALELLEAKRQMIEDELARVAGEDARGTLAGALRARMAGLIRRATEGDIAIEPAWARTAGESLVSGPEGRALLGEHLSEAQRGAFQLLEGNREAAVTETEVELGTVLIASELRLREPQAKALSEQIESWLGVRGPTRSQVLAGDLVDEMLGVRSLTVRLLPVQLELLERMRSAERPKAPAPDDPGDDLALGRGRYPEDDYMLEAAALCQFRGWSWSDCPELGLAAGMLGREARRAGDRPTRFGDAALFKTLTNPANSELWRELVARREALSGAEGADPGPLYADDPDALIGARVELLLAHLDRRLRLGPDQHQPVRDALVTFVTREYTARTRAFGALDEETLWRELRFIEGKDPRRGSSSRKRLCKALDEALTPPQRLDLGL